MAKKESKASRLLRAEVEMVGMEKVAKALGCGESNLYRLLDGTRGPGLALAAKALEEFNIGFGDWGSK